MHMFTRVSTLFLTGLMLAAPACDDGDGFGDGALDLRDCPNCTTGGLSNNTSVLGDHALSNLSMTLNQGAANSTGSVKITGGSGKYLGSWVPITQIDVEADGELRLKLGTAGWIQGVNVKGAWFDVTITPNVTTDPVVTGKLKIYDVKCEAGKKDPTMSICKYQFVTDVVPFDTDRYPHTSKDWNWYHTCPADDDGGLLDGFEKFSSVLSPQVTLSSPVGGTPSVDLGSGSFINGCLNGAVSKGQYYLNAFYDSTAYRGLHPSQRTAMLLTWMAWFDGQLRTAPGQQISLEDPIGGLFHWNSAYPVEAGYAGTGAVCRGMSQVGGVHRLFNPPMTAIANWSTLPACPTDAISTTSVIGVRVPN